MNARQAVARLEAFKAGRPLPCGETSHFLIAADADILMLAFLRMGGESGPWAIGFAHPRQTPTILCVPEPRNRDLVAEMVAELAPVLLEHLRHPEFCDDTIEGPGHERPHRQVWLPNGAHLEMLHHLAYAYTFTKWGEKPRARLLNSLGRATNWLFNEGHRPGQVSAMPATDALTESYTFPCETVRQGHLGYLLAWLETKGDRAARMKAATTAELKPVSTNLEPTFERDAMAPLVEAWNEAAKSNDKRRMDAIAQQIKGELESEMLRRLRLVEKAIQVLRRDERDVNPGVADLRRASASEHWFQYLRLEQDLNDEKDGPAFTPSPETDRYPAAAASRFFVHEDSEELRIGMLIHHDADIRAEAVAEGEAIVGTITQVHDEGTGRKTIPVWTIEGDGSGPLRLREGNKVCVADVPKRTGTIRQVDQLPSGRRRYEVEVTGWLLEKRLPGRRRIPHAASEALKDTDVILLKHVASGLARVKSQRVWNRTGPGAWLTHQAPRGPKADLPTEVGEDMKAIEKALEGDS